MYKGLVRTSIGCPMKGMCKTNSLPTRTLIKYKMDIKHMFCSNMAYRICNKCHTIEVVKSYCMTSRRGNHDFNKK